MINLNTASVLYSLGTLGLEVRSLRSKLCTKVKFTNAISMCKNRTTSTPNTVHCYFRDKDLVLLSGNLLLTFLVP